MKELLDFTEVVKDCTGGNVKIKQSNYLSEGALPVVDQGQELIAGYIDDGSIKYKGALPCVIFGDHTCILKYVDFDFVLGADGTKVLAPDLSKINAKYLYYFLTTVHVPDRGYSRHFKYLKQCKIPLVSLPEQKKIVKILDTADSLRQKRKEQLKLLDDYLKSVFLEMFGDPVKNEKKWEIKKLEDVCLKITDGTHQPPKFSSKGIPFIFISNIVENEITLQTKKYISEETYHELTRTTPIEVKDILYTTVGSYGNPAIVETEEKFCFQRHIAQLKPNHNKINYIYLFGILKSPMIKNQADRKVRGIAQKTLNLGDLKKFNLFLPPKEKQLDFATVIQKVEQTKQKMRASLDEMDNHFNALMQRYFG